MLKLKSHNNKILFKKFVTFDRIPHSYPQCESIYLKLIHLRSKLLHTSYQLKLDLFVLDSQIPTESKPDTTRVSQTESTFDENLKTFKRELSTMYVQILDSDRGSLDMRIALLLHHLVDLALYEKTGNYYLFDKEAGIWKESDLYLNRLIFELTNFLLDITNEKREKSVRLTALVEMNLKKMAAIIPNFDSRYLVLSNGDFVLDRKKAQVLTNDSSYTTILKTDLVYNPNASCPFFQEFLVSIFQSDYDTIRFVQEWFGYVLLSSHKANLFLIGYGSGANGKSLLFNLLAKLLGVQNVSSANLNAFSSSFGLEVMQNKPFNLSTESDINKFETATLKAITAGEPVVVNRKGLKEITVVLDTKLTFLVNTLPSMIDSSYGIERRMLLLPFNKTFHKDEQDTMLFEKLEKELSGIFNWALEGAQRVLDNDYAIFESPAMIKVKEDYFNQSNPLKLFIKETVEYASNGKVDLNTLFSLYGEFLEQKDWIDGTASTNRNFAKQLSEALQREGIRVEKRKSNGKTIFNGIKLVHSRVTPFANDEKNISTLGTVDTEKKEEVKYVNTETKSNISKGNFGNHLDEYHQPVRFKKKWQK